MSKGALLNLSPEQVKFYDDNGYLVLDKFATPEHIHCLKTETDRLIDQWSHDPSYSTFQTFSTQMDQPNQGNDYFHKSITTVVPFFEAAASLEKGCTFKQCVNKLAHGLHMQDSAYGILPHCKATKDVCLDLGVTNPVIPQSMYIMKSARTGGEISPHQDDSFLFTENPSCIAFWLALDDATPENGCVWIIPGSHKEGVHTKYQKLPDGTTRFDPPIGDTWKYYDLSKFVPVPVSSGSMLIFHGSVVHMSHANTSDKSRHAYTWHIVSADQTWSPLNWLGPGPFQAVKGV